VTAPAADPVPDPYMRLIAFKARHPRAVIGKAEFSGGWEATVPLPRGGEKYWKPVLEGGRPRSLDELLDVLEADLDSGPRAAPT
jgi:hypothetical protein